MSDFADAVDADMSAVVLDPDEGAAAVTYTPVGGAGVSRNAVPVMDVGALDEFQNVTFVMSNDATIGVQSPQNGDQITWDGDVYTVVKIREIGGVAWEIRGILPETRA